MSRQARKKTPTRRTAARHFRRALKHGIEISTKRRGRRIYQHRYGAGMHRNRKAEDLDHH
jgi:hypothetical protein